MDFFAAHHHALILGQYRNSGSVGSFGLDSAFTYDSAGDAFQYRYFAETDDSISEIYVYCASIGGTGGTLRLEVRDSASTTKAGSTVLATKDFAASAAAWIGGQLDTPLAVVQGTRYFIVGYNAHASPTTNFPAIQNNSSCADPAFGTYNRGYTSTNGLSSQTSQEAFPVAIKLSSEKIVGTPWITTANPSSTVNAKGLWIPSMPFSARLNLVINPNSIGSATLIEIYKGSQAQGSADYSRSMVSAGELDSGLHFLGYDMVAGTQYRICHRRAGGTNTPSYFIDSGGAGSPQAVKDLRALVGGCAMGYSEWNGSAWVDYDDRVGRMQLWFESLTSSSGGRPATMRRGMA